MKPPAPSACDRSPRSVACRPRRPPSADRGQATVELALAMPLLCLLLLGVVQLAIVVRDQLAAGEAARIGVRAAAVAADPGSAAASAVAESGGTGSGSPRASTTVSGRFVTVRVSITSPTDVPLIGALLPDIEVRGSATMILEPP